MERPIIFNDAMARAILSGAKTETRRPVCRSLDETTAREIASRKRPFGKPGDTLWVREAWRVSEICVREAWQADKLSSFCEFRCDGKGKVIDAPAFALEARRWSKKLAGGKWAPSIHMPRWAARCMLDVIDVRVERLQDMSEEDARDEGFETRAAFCGTWDVIYPTMGMRHNPWVWVVRFKRQGGA